jgi:hypothetical protein
MCTLIDAYKQTSPARMYSFQQSPPVKQANPLIPVKLIAEDSLDGSKLLEWRQAMQLQMYSKKKQA